MIWENDEQLWPQYFCRNAHSLYHDFCLVMIISRPVPDKKWTYLSLYQMILLKMIHCKKEKLYYKDSDSHCWGEVTSEWFWVGLSPLMQAGLYLLLQFCLSYRHLEDKGRECGSGGYQGWDDRKVPSYERKWIPLRFGNFFSILQCLSQHVISMYQLLHFQC